jgi:IS4 transposase
VTDRYVNEREFGDNSEFEQKFENLTREVADENLNNIVVICDKASVLDDKKYRAFVAIEVTKEDIMNGIDRKLTNNQKLQVDYDKKKFEEIFNQEMDKMAEERGL